MSREKIPGSNIIPRKWPYEKMVEESLKFKTISEFREKSPRAYGAVWRSGKYKEITAHLTRSGGNSFKYLYRLYFPNKTIYIGITYRIDYRFAQHKTSENEELRKELKKNKPYKIKISGLMPALLAGEIETKMIAAFRRHNWNVLNKDKGGAQGGNNSKWNKGNLPQEAKKYPNRRKFREGSGGAYQAAAKLAILDEICSFMGKRKNQAHTLEEMKSAALKFDRKIDFIRANPGMRGVMKRKGVYDEYTSHMNGGLTKRTLENLRESASKFNRRVDFAKGDPNAYASAASKGILDDICHHMTSPWQSK